MGDGHLPPERLRLADDGLALTEQAHIDVCAECQAERVRLRPPDPAAGEATGMELPPATPAVDDSVLARGTNIGRYVVLGPLGTGAMGVVYTAYDPELDRRLALKLLRVQFGTSHGQKGLLSEAQAMARLSHPNVVAVHDVGTFGARRVFVAMEWVKGRTAREWMRKQRRSWKEVWTVFQAAGEGLAAAHAAGLVHRDFKPANVLMGEDGRICVTDFGIATALSGPATAGGAAGTPAYMAPEQHAGKPGDPRMDQFSFGVALYEALYGARPFSSAAIRKNLWAPPPPPAGTRVPAWAHRLVIRAISEDPTKRFATMRDLLTAMAQDPAQRRWRRLMGGGVVAAVLVAIALTRSLSPQAQQQCAQAGREIEATWNPAKAAAMEAAFLRTGAPAAADAVARIKAHLQQYAGQWSTVKRDACEATRDKGTQSDEVLSLRMECLDRRRQELEALANVFASADAALVGQARQAAYALGDLQQCSDVLGLRARVKPPKTSEDRTRVQAERGQLARAHILSAVGRMDEAEAVSQAALKAARGIAYPPLEAEALYRLGSTLAARGASDGGKTLSAAVSAGITTADDEVVAQAATALALLECRLNRTPEAERWLFLAEPFLERLEKPLELRVAYLRAQAMSALDGGDPQAVLEALDDGLAALRKAGRERDPDVADLLVLRGQLQRELAAVEEAEAALKAGHVIREQTLGAQHADTLAALGHLTRLMTDSEQLDKALAYGRQALELTGREGTLAASALLNLGEAEWRRRDWDAAESHLQEALGAAGRSPSPDSALLARCLDALAELALERGQARKALQLFQRSLELRERIQASTGERALSLAGVGLAQLRLNPPAAMQTLTRARALLRDGGRPLEQGLVKLALAQGTLSKAPIDARALAAEALAAFQKSHVRWRIRATQAWIDAHGG